MSVYCLIHGTSMSERSWRFLAPRLEARGHRVVTPHLPGGLREEELADFGAMIEAALAGIEEPVVLVGHGGSGAYLPMVAARRPIAHMVFLAAFVPRPGHSLLDEFQQSPDLYTPEWIAAGEAGLDPTQDRQVADRFLFHDCPKKTASWAWKHAMQLMVPTAAYGEPLPLGSWPEAAASLIVPAEDRTFNPDWQRRAARDYLEVAPIELPGGHCPQLSRPEALAELLTSPAIAPAD